MKYIILISVLLLGGCAHVPQVAVAVPYHQITKAPPAAIVAKPIVAPSVVAPAVPQAKQTFKQRWLSRFFRKRAVQQ